VFIAILCLGAIAALVFGIWGYWRGKQIEAARQYRFVEEETNIGKMVNLEMSELTNVKKDNEDYF
jgi:hypothetical protein